MGRQFLMFAPVNSRFVISRGILHPDRDCQPMNLPTRFPARHVHGMQPGRQIDWFWHAPQQPAIGQLPLLRMSR